MNVFEIKTDAKIGYPQSFFTVINGVSFMFSFRYNAIEDFLIASVVRVFDKTVVFHGKLVPGYDIAVYEPVWRTPYFSMLPITTDKENVQIVLGLPGMS